jgi:Tfp pilus assembly PilM family ATPase
MNQIKLFLQKILSSLSVRSLVGGLEISDQVLRLVYYSGKTWQLAAIRLAPGVLEKGKIKDRQAFIVALQELKAKVPFGKKKGKKMNVVVSLSSVNMYSQVFTLPIMQGKELTNAVDLNVKMLSPVDITQTYFGWEVLGNDETSLKAEVAAAFIDRPLVDDMVQALYAAGFITVGVESRALALVRIFRQKGSGADVNKSYLLLDVDNSGIDFLVIRKGKLYFEYATQWNDLADAKGQIYITKFKEALTADLRQVMNFSGQHWSEPIDAIILAATAFEKEAEEAVAAATSLPVIRMTLVMDQQVSLEWMVALGCSLRGVGGALRDKEINLSGEGAIDTFHREQLLNFVTLWRVLVPVVLGCLVIMFALADNFLSGTRSGINVQPAFNQQESAEMEALEASSTAFNQSVALVANAESKLNKDYLLIADIESAAVANGITIQHLSFQSPGSPILVAGAALSETQIVAFKNAIQNNPHFGAVNLPLTNIQGDASSSYTFSMEFPLTSGF